MRKIIKKRGNKGTGCIVITKEELKIQNLKITDIIEITIKRRPKK